MLENIEGLKINFQMSLKVRDSFYQTDETMRPLYLWFNWLSSENVMALIQTSHACSFCYNQIIYVNRKQTKNGTTFWCIYINELSE